MKDGLRYEVFLKFIRPQKLFTSTTHVTHDVYICSKTMRFYFLMFSSLNRDNAQQFRKMSLLRDLKLIMLSRSLNCSLYFTGKIRFGVHFAPSEKCSSYYSDK